jgi:hypothetical protein
MSPLTPKSGIVEPEEMAIARQQLSKHNPLVMNTCTAVE